MRRISMILIIFLATLFIPGACARPAESVTFVDTKLEAAIREAVHKPEGPIQMSDLEPLTTLIAEVEGIQNLAGLEYCVYLCELEFFSNNLSDLSPLASLTNLQRLHLRFDNISDLSPLSGLTNLEYLNLYLNNISDLSPLSGLTNLEYLILDQNNISDLSPLSGLTNLRELSLWGNNISDLSPLASLTNLTVLGLGANQISDLSPLVENSGLGAGDEIWLDENNLDLSEGSEDMDNIRALEDRGVIVSY